MKGRTNVKDQMLHIAPTVTKEGRDRAEIVLNALMKADLGVLSALDKLTGEKVTILAIANERPGDFEMIPVCVLLTEGGADRYEPDMPVLGKGSVRVDTNMKITGRKDLPKRKTN